MSIATTHPTREGRVAVPGGNDWYQIVGEGDAIPLLLLHGGPGAAHWYLEPLAGLAGERPVVFFDQLGCGLSDRPDDTSLWRIERFVQEVDAVRQGLGLEQVHLLGQSWGGWLAIEYMLTQPKGVVSLTLASTSSSTRQFVEEAEKLKAQLPPEMVATMRRCEAAGDYTDPEYEAAVMEFYRRHLCRLPEWPECVMKTAEELATSPVYATMNGPNEFTITGNLKDWDRTDRLHEIDVPTLITVGRYDEITPVCAATMRERIPNAEMVIFEHSGHCAHVEETERYLSVLGDFLRRVET